MAFIHLGSVTNLLDVQPKVPSVERLHASRRKLLRRVMTLLSADISALPFLLALFSPLSHLISKPGQDFNEDIVYDPPQVGLHVQSNNLYTKHDTLDEKRW